MLAFAQLLTFFLIAERVALAQTQAGQALVVPPSGQWDGADGPWSTFNLGIGEPLQLIRCIPAFSVPVVVLPLTIQCNDTTKVACPGRTEFNSSASTTYSQTGFYRGPFEGFESLQSLLPKNTTRNARWGVDKVYFGNDAVRDLGFAEQYVIEWPSSNILVGVFGLAMGSVSLAEFTTGKPNLLNALFAAGVAPSNTVSYTAGSIGTNSSGSLVLGGYDTSRFNASTTLSVQMPNKQNNSLIVDVLSISTLGSTNLEWAAPAEPASRQFRIEAFIPQIWLPQAACEMFETAFGLQWNSSLELYTVNETTHERLVREKPSVRFSIGATSTSQHQAYVLPYSVFDLRLAPPLVATETYYFPLKRAANSSQYVLGRAFLQGTYITVDYGRANFSLSQAYPAGGSGYIVPISNVTASNGTAEMTESSDRSKKLPAGAYAGIGVSVGIVALLAFGLLLSWKKRWGPFGGQKPSSEQDDFVKSELDGNGKSLVEIMEKERGELRGESEHEAMGKEAAELETVELHVEADQGPHLVYEMHGDSVHTGGKEELLKEPDSRTEVRNTTN